MHLLNSGVRFQNIFIINNIEMNKSDKEILKILKETFRKKHQGDLIDPDDAMSEMIIKNLLAISIFGLIVLVIMFLIDKEMPSDTRFIVATPISMFFWFLFMHINNKSENTSIIMFVLTWVSMTLVFIVS